jgi:hypothetical protein
MLAIAQARQRIKQRFFQQEVLEGDGGAFLSRLLQMGGSPRIQHQLLRAADRLPACAPCAGRGWTPWMAARGEARQDKIAGSNFEQRLRETIRHRPQAISHPTQPSRAKRITLSV